MTMVREDIPKDEWEYFDSLNIQFQGKHKTANEYSTWVIDREREIIFTRVQTPGRDYGPTYILIWGISRVYVYVESHSEWHTNESIRKHHWDIKYIEAPLLLKDKREQLISLIREVSDVNYDRRNSAVFVIDGIVEPRFVEEK